ncbi:MAG: FtsX-like permease family protein [Candidatus Nitrosotenuis sp.]
MKINELVLLSCNALYDRKVRTILTVLMVVVGSSLIVILNGLTAGQNEFIKNQLSQLAPNILYVTPGQQSFRGDSSAASIVINDVVVNRIRSLSYVEEVIPQYRGSVQLNSQGNIVSASVLSMNPEKLLIIFPKIEFEEGSLLKPGDPSAMLVGYNIAYPPGKDVAIVSTGQTVRASVSYVDSNGIQQTESRSFVVSGIVELTGDNQIDNAVVINHVAGMSLLHKTGRYDRLIVAVQSPDHIDAVQEEIKRLYGSTIGLNSPRAILAIRQQFASGNASFILSVGFIALVVGAVGIVTSLYTSVTERIKEIGTIKAIGAQNSAILLLFLVEALLIGVIGATVGILVGIMGGYSMSSFFSPPGIPGARNATITPMFLGIDLVRTWLLSVGLSVLAGIFPAWKASRLSPMVALRRE